MIERLYFLDVEPNGDNTYANAQNMNMFYDWFDACTEEEKAHGFNCFLTYMEDIVGFKVNRDKNYFMLNKEQTLRYLADDYARYSCEPMTFKNLKGYMRSKTNHLSLYMGLYPVVSLEEFLLNFNSSLDDFPIYLNDCCKVIT